MTDINYPAPAAANAASTAQPQVSHKSFVVTWILALLLGTLGIDRFYLGKIGTGILKLITAGGFGVWTLIDIFLVLSGSTRDKNGLPLAEYAQNKRVAIIVTIVVLALGVVSSIISAVVQAALLNN
ncbi:TM2 domain-containing protein [Glaciibacter superstes]|uniref:TM2 domain-containing protein n=1 Tax=Glaciibacter superstes TaxID=501023 RepID=UPI000425CF81|nr:TM2 domain-containing protein [Glaciibacter superstes]